MFAPLVQDISNQFVEDLKKIAELMPFVDDLVLDMDKRQEVVYSMSKDLKQFENVDIVFKRTDFGREMILPLYY